MQGLAPGSKPAEEEPLRGGSRTARGRRTVEREEHAVEALQLEPGVEGDHPQGDLPIGLHSANVPDRNGVETNSFGSKRSGSHRPCRRAPERSLSRSRSPDTTGLTLRRHDHTCRGPRLLPDGS
jgi:hypothetical protein